MLFNSLDFAVFFPVVTLLFFLLPARARVPMLVVASCIFYARFVPAYLLILFGVIIVDYVAGRLIESAQGARRKWMLGLSLGTNFAILAVFKYFDFLATNLASVAQWLGGSAPFEPMHLLLPIGLSFHTFQSMSYTIEVYRGHTPAEKSLVHFAVYVLFYPQLVAGPIERPQNLLPQFHATQTFDGDRLFVALRLMATGLFKKVIIADRLAPLVDAAYRSPGEYSGFELLIATYLFAVQIYCDFSGYSDIARGAAWAMGYDLMENFRKPYLSASFSDFWRRWHISLSTWFRDYLYIPLGGNRAGLVRRALNLLIVFAISGLWHGANWTFAVWGLLHGVFLMVELGATRGQPKAQSGWLITSLRFLLVFNLTCLAWVFFRASDLAAAKLVLGRIGGAFAQIGTQSLMTDAANFWSCMVLIAGLFAVEIIGGRNSVWSILDGKSRWLRWAVYYFFALAFAVFALTAPQHEAKAFIYFQF